MKRILHAAVAVLLVGGAHLAMAQNLVVNPSFETVSTQTVNTSPNIVDVPDSWTQAGSTGCAFQALAVGDTAQSGGDFTIGTNAAPPTDGARVLISDQGPSNTSCRIFQDVALPAGSASISLTLDAGFTFRNNGTFGSNGLVTVTTTAGVLLLPVYSRTDVQGTDALAARAVDLTPFAGQTVRIVGTINEVGSDWAGLQIDNVQVIAAAAPAAPPVPTPTLSNAFLLLLATLLGLGGWIAIRRMPRG